MSDVPGEQQPSDGGERVLIVEDEMLIAAYLEDTLDALGYRACGTAGSAEEAVELAQLHRPGVALVDIGLRGRTDGIALARELTERLGVAVIFLSGATDAGTLRAAEAARPHGFLAKPCTEQEIASVLRSATAPSPKTR